MTLASGNVGRYYRASMFDIQHDSPVPIHEQITEQIREHIASGSLAVGVSLMEYRAFAQELLTNPQVISRAYAELETEGVLVRTSGGAMAVTASAAVICRVRLQDGARERIRQAVARGLACGLKEGEIALAVQREIAASKVRPLSGDELLQAIEKPKDESRHRASQSIQDLSRKSRSGLP